MIRLVLKHCVERLSPGYGTDEAIAISRWLISSVTGRGEQDISFSNSDPADDAQLEKVNEHLVSLLQGVPLQYVLEEAWFCGLKFHVDKRVLIPRPETEELVEWIVDDIRFPLDKLRILDLGTGSGCIPIALRRRLGTPEVYGCDISRDALAVARMNAARLAVSVDFFQYDMLSDALPACGRLDILVSNPPYIPLAEMHEMATHVTEHEPHGALFVPDNDPLLFYRSIARKGKELLNSKGIIYLELHSGHGVETADLFTESGYRVELRKDMSGNTRMLKAIRS